MKHVSLVLAALLIAGCATPKVEYSVFSQDSPRTSIGPHADSYMLAKTSILLDEVSNAAKPETSEITIQFQKRADSDYAFAINPHHRNGVRTQVSLVKVDNTQLIQSATISLEDKRTELIAKSSKLLATVIGIAVKPAASSMARPTRKLPAEIDTLALMRRQHCLRQGSECSGISALNELQHGILAVLDVGAVPPDAIDREVFLGSLANASEVLAFSACREATITVVVPEGQRSATARFSLADPRYLQLVKLPMKGSITAHSECGYSVVPEDVQVASSVDLAQAALDELIKLKDAYDKGTANAGDN